MIVQDSQTGYYHEIPDQNVEGYGQVVYDGLGNPVGFIGPILDAVRNVASNIPIVGGLVNTLLPGSRPPAPPSPMLPLRSLIQPPMLPMPLPTPPPLPGTVMPPMPFPEAGQSPWPYHWVRPQGPLVTGPGRLYLRCSTWPGQPGLVPSDPVAPGLPAQPFPPVPQPILPPGGGFFRRRRPRRRR
jgi:hypothetical protein